MPHAKAQITIAIAQRLSVRLIKDKILTLRFNCQLQKN